MEMFLVIILITVVVVYLMVFERKSRPASNDNSGELLDDLSRQNIEFLKQDLDKGLLSIMPPQGIVNLKDGEYIVFLNAVTLYEERKKSYYGGASVRVIKGVYFRAGRSQGVSSLARIDHGRLLLTTRRLIFVGQLATRITDLSKLINISVYTDMITINREGKVRAESYDVDSPMEFKLLYEAVLSDDYVRLDEFNLVRKTKLNEEIEFQNQRDEWLEEQQSRQSEAIDDRSDLDTELTAYNDDLYEEALEIALRNQGVTTSNLQMSLRIGYARATRLIGRLQSEGVIRPKNQPLD